MNKILRDLSTANLITAIEENMFSFLSYSHKCQGSTAHEDSEISWVMTDIPSPLFNSIYRAQLPLEKIDFTIDAIIDKAKKRNISLFWYIGPATQPSDLAEYLKKHGFVKADQTPGMAVNLEYLRDDLSTPVGLTVQLVENDESLKQWCQVLATFGLSDLAIDAYYYCMHYFDSDKTLAYLGMLNNQPVAISLLHLEAGVAGIYCVATIPEARRQGIGAWITQLPLREAQQKGYQAGILLSSEQGVGVYSSLGFQEYCKVEQYLWSQDKG